VVLLVVHWRDGLTLLARRLTLFAAAAAVPLLPFLLFLELNGGTVTYFRSAGEYIRSEADRGGVLKRPTFAFDWSQPLVAMHDQPRELPRVRVEWSSRVSPAQRADLEQQYGLTGGVAGSSSRERQVWTYGLLDDSRENLAALVADRRINDTGGIDRDAARLKQSGTTVLEALWREHGPRASIAPLPGVLTPANTIAWLYHLFVLVPLAALMVLVFRRRDGVGQAARVAGLTVLCLIAQRALLRDPLQARLGDVAAPTAILGAWLLAHLLPRRASGLAKPPAAWRRYLRPAGRVARLLLALIVLAATASSVAMIGRLGAKLESAAVLAGPGAMAQNFRETVVRLKTSPPLEAPDGISAARQALARYVRACTAPTDRLLVTWFAPELYYYTDRAFAAGQLFWFDGYHDSPAEQARTVEILRQQSVPIIIDRTRRAHSLQAFEQVKAYVDDHYYLAGTSGFGELDTIYRILVRRDLAAVGIDRQLSLPCFQR
jgi:hypothetical protein